MTTPIAREKDLALTVLFELRDGLLKRFWNDLQYLLTPEELAQFVSRVRFEEFN